MSPPPPVHRYMDFEKYPEYMDADMPLVDNNLERAKLLKLSLPNYATVWMKYNKLRQVGYGTFGAVYKACSKTDPTKIVAVKQIIEDNKNKQGISEGVSVTTLREIKILKTLKMLKHENLVELIEVCAGEANFSNHFIADTHLVFEFCENDLAGLLAKTTGARKVVSLNEGHIKSILKQLFEALFFLHENRIMHRDLKPANVLITRSGVLKVADFGLGKSVSKTIPKLSTPNMVTLWYRAPEILLGDQHYNFPADMWSAGCIMAELYSDGAIFKGGTEQHVLQLINELCGPIDETSWPAVSELSMYHNIKLDKNIRRTLRGKFSASILQEGGMDLLEGLLLLDPEKRINANTACNHRYLWTGAYPDGLKELLARLGNNNFNVPIRLDKMRRR